MKIRTLVLASILFVSFVGTAHADDRPSSGTMSILSGRTLGNGQSVLSGGIGWPSVWAMYTIAPSSKFNLGFRGAVTYGSLMGFDPGVGGTVSIPLRLHLFSGENTDFAVFIEPGISLGEGALFGQFGTFANDFGYSIVTNGGIVMGLSVSDAVTMVFGAGSDFAYVDVPDVPDGNQLVGTVHGIVGVEAVISRDTMLMGEFRLGYGFAPDLLFENRAVARLSLGLAYLM